MAEITVTVDGVKYADHVEPRMLLVHYLREVVGKTGTPIGCDTSNCGACTVLLDGQSVKSCSVLAVQTDGADITTIQGLANGGLHPLQRAFHEEHALQCGYCTPGMITGGVGPAPGESAPQRRGDPRGSRGQPVPLHRLREHRARRTARRAGGSERMTAQTEAPEAKTAELGKARLRKEDERLITGQTNWTDNITLPGMLHIAFLRSPYAHARITSVDVSAARNEPGVIAAYSGADFAAEQGSLPCAWPVTPDIVIPAHPPMAVDEVRYVGEAVACVVARDRFAAADALAAIEVDYEQLPPVLDMRTALDEASPKVHEAGNKSFVWPFVQGDMDAAFRDAPIVIERTYRQQRLIPAAMEPRAVVCSSVGGEFTLWSATQIPHILRVMLALVTGIPEQNIRVIAPDVGGGFGSKLQVTAEEVLAVLIARKLGRPVKWTESRSEGNMTVHHGRDQWQRIRIAADSDGRLRGLDVDLLADMGAYLMLVTPGIPILGAFMYPAIYKMDAYSFKCTGVFTTKMPTDAYRGAGRPEATFAIERIMDELAAHLGVDPLVVRERNWIKHEEFPYTTIATLTYDSGNYEAATAKAKDLFGYDELRKEQEQRRASNDPVQLGIGISTFTEMCGLAPSRVLGSLAYAAGGWEQASIRMLPTGKVEVVTGSSAHGQGHETAWSQIVADQLGVPFEDIRVLHGDTQISPKGMDTYGSRSLAVGGMALVSACDKVIDKAKVIAAGMLEASADDLEWSPGRFAVRGDPDKGVTIGEIAFTAFAAHNLPDGVEPSIDAEATYDPDNFSFPHGTHLCATEVDTETGFVKIRSYVGVDDIGAVVNPMIVDGQVHGGVAQGIAQALYEEAVYDDDGNLVTSTLADYLVPSAADLPSYVTDRTESRAANRARRQGRRRSGHDRLDPCGGQRDRRRAAAAGHRRRRDALHARAGVAGHPGRPGRRAGQRGRAARGPAERPDPGPQPAGHRHPRPDRRRRHDPGEVRLRPSRLAGRGGLGPGRGRRRRQGHRGRAEPAPAAAAAAGLSGTAGRRGRPGRAARRHRRRGRTGHRRADHAPPADPRPAGSRALRAAGAGRRHGGRPGGPAPRHARRLARARRPGR